MGGRGGIARGGCLLMIEWFGLWGKERGEGTGVGGAQVQKMESGILVLVLLV